MRVFPHLCACEKRKVGCLAPNQTTAASRDQKPGERWSWLPSDDAGVSNGPGTGNSRFSKYGGATFSSRQVSYSAPVLVQDGKPPPTPNGTSPISIDAGSMFNFGLPLHRVVYLRKYD